MIFCVGRWPFRDIWKHKIESQNWSGANIEIFDKVLRADTDVAYSWAVSYEVPVRILLAI